MKTKQTNWDFLKTHYKHNKELVVDSGGSYDVVSMCDEEDIMVVGNEDDDRCYTKQQINDGSWEDGRLVVAGEIVGILFRKIKESKRVSM